MGARRWVVAILLVAVLLAGVSLAYLRGPGPLAFAGSQTVPLSAYRAGQPTGVPLELAPADALARGRYLTQAADCQACHTPEGGAAFIGGRPFKTPFGTLYSTNLTPDRDTGLGAWDEAQFLRALHEGVRPDGTHLYPAFPYAAYTALVDEDVRAIYAYLRSLAPVHHPVPANELGFPFNQRWLMGLWSALFNPDRRFAPYPQRTPEWNRGAYLAEALGHCGECHTPRNVLQALNQRRKFAGALTNGWQAYNITTQPASGVGAWTDEELAQYLATGHAAHHGTASGPMGEAVQMSLSHLTPGDVQALVTYLRSIPALSAPDLPAVRTEPASAAPGPAAAGGQLGRDVFAGACAGCHPWSGTSELWERASLLGARAVNDPSAVNVVQIVLHGFAPAGEGRDMPAFGADYSDEEIAAVANFVTARFGARGAALSAAEVARLRARS
ncbi:MAG: cytochrome c [Gammaproteobacteria bacterium]|nr:cytochrome c [Gammaproteobacteria bacterium]